MNELLFPRCGITMQHVKDIAEIANNKRDAARRLGICERQFYAVIAKHRLGYLFASKHPRPRRVSADDIIELARQGFTRRDTAYLLKISDDYLKVLIRKWKLAGEFTVNKGKAAWTTRRGYVGD